MRDTQVVSVLLHVRDSPPWQGVLVGAAASPSALILTNGHKHRLNDFNHHHHHCVMTGDAARYSSTHRVAVQVKDTWKYIAKRTAEALGLVQQALRLDAAALRAVGETAGEVEFQWLRMFWLQVSKKFWRRLCARWLVS